jgi:outer membrane receptor protein involved in Fe transport
MNFINRRIERPKCNLLSTIATPHRLALHVIILLSITFYTPIGIPRSCFAQESSDLPATELTIKGAIFEVPEKELAGSVSIINQQDIQDRSLLSFQQTVNSIPGLQWAGGTSTPRFFQIRGIGEVEQYQGAPNPSVGVIIDNIDYSGIGVIVPLFDIEQIEVLKGPQSIRFGSSALAGVIDMQSVDLSALTSGEIQLSAGNDEYKAGSFAVGGAVPLTGDRLQLRISSSHSHQNGFRDNLFLNRDDTNERDQHTTRVKLKALPSDDLTVQLTTLMVDNNNGFDAFSIDNSLNTQSDKPGSDQVESRAGALTFDYKLAPNIELKSITTHSHTNIDYSYDGDWGNNQFWQPYAPYDYFSASDRTRKTNSQEFRLTRADKQLRHDQDWRGVVGIFAQRLQEDSQIQDQADSFIYNSISSRYKARSGAIFGEIAQPIGVGRSFELGGRLERRLMDYDDDRQSDFNPSNQMWAAHTALKQDISEEALAFAQISKGFKGGGFNPGTRVPNDLRIYNPESQWNFEVGIKGSSRENSLTYDASIFHALRRDAQLKFAFQDNPSDPLSFTYVTESVARGESTGIESNVNWQATQKWRFFANGMLMESNYTSVPLAVNQLQGRSYTHAPNWQFATGTTYNISETLFIQSDLSRQGAFYFDDSQNQKSTPYSILNVSTGYRDQRWSWTLWAKNLLSENYPVRGFYFGNEPPDFPNTKYVQRGDPLFFGTTVTLSF